MIEGETSVTDESDGWNGAATRYLHVNRLLISLLLMVSCTYYAKDFSIQMQSDKYSKEYDLLGYDIE
jgi:hypothetical protein